VLDFFLQIFLNGNCQDYNIKSELSRTTL